MAAELCLGQSMPWALLQSPHPSPGSRGLEAAAAQESFRSEPKAGFVLEALRCGFSLLGAGVGAKTPPQLLGRVAIRAVAL